VSDFFDDYESPQGIRRQFTRDTQGAENCRSKVNPKKRKKVLFKNRPHPC
jgi:hypothetical protein